VNKWGLVVGALVFSVSVIAGCSSAAAPVQLTVLAASSLSSSLDDLKAAWKTGHPNTTLVTSTGATSALRTRIEQGAPADVLLGADTANAQALVDEGDATGPVTEFTTNALTVIVPANNPAGIATPADLARPGVCVIAAGPDVPITRYATQLISNLATRPEYGPDFGARYEANVCSREDNVGAVVNKVSLGEGDAAIVYVSDAKVGQNLTSIELPDGAQVVATYGGVALKASPNAAAATEFLGWMRGQDAQTVLSRHGFGQAP
jgi:molybdate transport system substrate-binding protein